MTSESLVSTAVPCPFPVGGSATLDLHLKVADPEVISELEKHHAGPDREHYGLAALRLGTLALRQARGELDAAAIRDAGQQIFSNLESLFRERGREITGTVTGALRQYFDPASGELPRRLESLLRHDGDLERFLRQQVGPENSILTKTLEPLLHLLDPNAAQGFRVQIESTMKQIAEGQREQVLRQFSLDNDDSAISRLLRKVTENNGNLTKDVRGLVDDLAKEFSLDKPNSALRRLMKTVEDSQSLIGKSLTLDDENSALSRLKRELQITIDRLAKDNADFQKEVRDALTRLQTQRETAAKSTLQGHTFEEKFGELLNVEAGRLNDVYESTGNTTGTIAHCKVGDFVTTLGPDSAAPGARIAWEAKSDKSYDLARALRELDQARKNRQAQVGIFVFSKDAAPAGLEPLARYGNDLVIVWDPEDASTDIFVRAAYTVARALVIRESHESAECGAALKAIESATRVIETQIKHVADVKTWADTIRNNGEKIADRAGKMQDALRAQVDELDRQLGALKSSGARAA
jgi:hypothetical protein